MNYKCEQTRNIGKNKYVSVFFCFKDVLYMCKFLCLILLYSDTSIRNQPTLPKWIYISLDKMKLILGIINEPRTSGWTGLRS